MSAGGDVHSRLSRLSPAQRALFEKRLMERRADAARASRITPRQGNGPVPLSYAQELLWLLTQVFDHGIAYNAPSAFKLEGPLDLERLKRAFELLVDRHQILRTTYSVIDGTPMQIVQPTRPLPMPVIDLRELPDPEREEQCQRILREESRFAFDLVNGPVIRPVVIVLSSREHVLFVNLHHIAVDGYSRTTIFEDLTALYEALDGDGEARDGGGEAGLEPLAIQYADFAVWQRAWLDSGVADAQLEYWKRKLAGAPARLDLPADFQRPAVRANVGEHRRMMLDLPTREALRVTARAHDATLFVALVSVFASLLGRYCGQDDVVIGTPYGGRSRTELDSMVGYLINPLALRIDLSGDPPFRELVQRARVTTVEAFANADVPYETVVRATNPERDLSQTPVFQTMVVYHDPAWQTKRPKFEPAGIRCSEISHEKGWSKFDVLVGFNERTTGLNTSWEYSTELFKASTVQRMMEHFRALAESAAADPDRRISKLSMLSEAERVKVVFGWNRKDRPLPERDSVKELFEEQVARTPDRPAVSFAGRQLTFAECNRRANRIAWMLKRDGVGPGDFVGIMMEKSLDLVPAVLGVIKAGAAYIPLDPLYPADRIAFMIADASPRLVLTHQRHMPVARGVAVDAPGTLEPLEALPDHDPPTVSRGDDLAYVIYTSGSTGQPKGAMITNRSLASAFFAYERAYRLHELRAHAQMASFSFDVFTGDLIRSLLVGAKLVLVAMETVIDPAQLFELMLREGVDAAEFVPATASLLFEYAQREGRRLDHMRLVIVSSEAWRTERYAFYKSLCGSHTRLINSYGLTEATIDSTWFEPDAGAELVPGRFVPIGGPLDNTNVYILDQHLEPQPIGIPGELCVGGVAVARGYLNRPDLTAQRFVADPFDQRPGALLYRTGDLARWLPDGTIDFLGRTDRQIKIRGFRIEPGEIEAMLERHPAIRHAAVVDRVDGRGETRLVAYIEVAGAAPEASALRGFLADQVPNYMLPSAYVALDQLPHTPNGKIDRDALPAPVWEQASATDAFVAPSTDTERQIAAIWSAVLGVEEIGARDNFFALGGHSLLAMQVMSRVRSELGVALALRAIFDAPTVSELAAAVDVMVQQATPAAPALVPRARRRAG